MAVLSIGAIAMDILINVSDIPKNDSFSFIHSSECIPGGSSSNFSCNLKSFRQEVYQFGGLGNDHYGHLMKNDLKNNNINIDYLKILDGESTLYNYVFTSENGDNSIVANFGTALEKVEYSQIDLERFNLMYTDMFSSKASLYLANKMYKSSGNIFYNMQCSPSFMGTCGISIKDIKKMMSISSILVMNRDVAKEVGGSDNIDNAIKNIHDEYQPKDGIICTLGSQGSIWYCNNNLIKSKSYNVDIINTVGAGDAFNAGFCYLYYIEGKDIEKSLMFANASAALKCTINGPRLDSSIDEIKRLINGGN